MKIIDYKGEIAAHWKSNKVDLLFLLSLLLSLSLSIALFEIVCCCVFLFVCADLRSIDFVVDHFDEVRQVNS